MPETDILQTILKDSSFDLSLFTEQELDALRSKVFTKTARGKETAFVRCAIRNKDIQLKPEEIVRQLYAARLMEQYGYPQKRIAFEHKVTFGREKKSADIVVFDKDRPDAAYIIVEVKKPKHKDGKEQLRSYCNATGSPMGVWTNGGQISHYHRKDPNYFEDITDIPKAGQSLQDILGERFTLRDLIIKDKIANERKSLKDIILDMEDEVLANAGVDVFEEVFKLIFTKLYDEYLSRKDKTKISFHLEQNLSDAERGDYDKLKKCLESLKDDKFRVMEFRNSGQTDTELKQKIQSIFDQAKNKWQGVFAEGTAFELSDSHLAVCVSSLQNVKLFNSNLLVVDEAFEYLVNKSSKGEKGQYFTPRHVIDMCVEMLNPQRGENMIDTASGSCGFPVHTIFKLTGHLFTNEEIPEEDKEHVLKVFGIDFDEKTVRVARTLNLIAGDGETNVLHLNTLDYDRWPDKTQKDPKWIGTYGKGFSRLEKLRAVKNEDKQFQFDLLMANPPFAGEIKEKRIIYKYELGFKDGKEQGKVGRDILFIERNLDFLRPGGRMAVVLPQGRFNNTSDRRIREFIAERARILAVIGLHGNTFKPHTGTKTSVLFVQKWNDDPAAGPLCPKVEDYPIFFAVSEKGGKDNSGEYVYVRNADGQVKIDKNGHIIVDHDLHSHGGELPDGIAEAFVEWAKKEKLSFFPDAPFDEARYKALLKGAKVKFSIKLLSEVLYHPDFRLDGEYLCFAPYKNKGLNYVNIEDILLSSQYGISIEMNEDGNGTKIYRMNEISNMLCNQNILKFAPISNDEIRKYSLKDRDVLFNRTNSQSFVGRTGMFKKFSSDDFVFASYLVRIKPDERLVFPEYLVAFLNTKYGVLDVKRRARMSINQSNVNAEELKRVEIPLISKELQQCVTDCFSEAFILLKESEKKYKGIENILLSELGLTNWQPKHQLSFVRNFSETEEAGRMDAEYFHPSYDQIVKAIEKTGQACSIKDLLSVCQRGKQPVYCDEGGIVINSKHVRNGETLIDDDNRKGDIASASVLIKKNDILMNGTGVGTIGRCSPYLHDHTAIPDNHVTVLRTKKMDSVFLAIQLDSLVGQMQVRKFQKGSSGQIELYPDDIKSFTVWNAPVVIQEEIRQKISESFILRRQSKHLLECAKQAVEIAIEQDEQTALAWLERETQRTAC